MSVDTMQAMEALADRMLATLREKGFCSAHVGSVNDEGILEGACVEAASSVSPERFMVFAKGRIEEMVVGGATVVVAGLSVVLFPEAKDVDTDQFGLGGPGGGTMERNLEASLAITGKEALKGVAVFGSDRREMCTRVYVLREHGAEPKLGEGIYDRMVYATKRLMGGLPWPAVN